MEDPYTIEQGNAVMVAATPSDQAWLRSSSLLAAKLRTALGAGGDLDSANIQIDPKDPIGACRDRPPHGRCLCRGTWANACHFWRALTRATQPQGRRRSG
jgi:hypothetical protein